MAEKSNVIVINGRKYDASTGQLIHEKLPTDVPHRVDGFAKPVNKETNPTSEPGVILSPKAVKKEVRRRIKNAKELHKSQSKGKTLVRSATEKPKKKSIISRIVTPANSVANKGPENDGADIANLTAKTPESRAKLAKASKRSTAISRFSDIQQNADKNVKSADNQRVTNVARPESKPSVKSQLIASQMAAVSSSDTNTSGDSAGKIRARPFAKTAAFLKRSPKVTTIVATSLAAVMLFGYITYLNIPNMAMRVAAVKAGFEASMPGYSPNGFKFSGPIAYSPGQITIQFSSNTDDREYNITERQTTWDSQSLLDNYVREETGEVAGYSTFRERGLTVFIYGGSNATWVNGGIWYTIDGDSLLSSEQLLRIAASL